VINELIDWNNFAVDPMFCLNFPQKNMLRPDHFESMAGLIQSGADRSQVSRMANAVRMDLNPHPAGQMEHNVPTYRGEQLPGVQHKYRETAIFFPSQGQTCHAFCTFCFRWPQFTGISSLKFAMKQTDLLIGYLREHPEISDVIFTGGDPMVMSAKNLAVYMDALLDAELPGLKNIRIGTKTLAFWPYRYLTDPDADEVLDIFRRVVDRGIQLAFMAHVSHTVELSTAAVQEAIGRILDTGAQIRTQAPVLNHINADADIWARMWKKQVSLGMIPYYMFVPRDTGAKEYFALPLGRTWQIFRKAYGQVSGICRTVRGPSMSATPGKVQIVGVAEVRGERVFVLNFLQARNPEWVGRPFFAAYSDHAYWLNDLKPAFGKSEFFYSREFRRNLKIEEDSMGIYAEELGRVFRKFSGKW
jgi:KamA family protein